MNSSGFFKYISFFFLFNIIIVYSYSQYTDTHNVYDKQKRIKNILKKNTGSNYDVKYHKFDWIINPDIFYIKGSVTTIFTTTQDNITQISFDMNYNLKVDSVIFHKRKLTFNQTTNNEVIINLGNIYSINKTDSIKVFYQGVPESNSYFGSFVQDYHDAISVPIIWTLSEPYGSEDWFPCKNNLNDKIDSIDVYVTTPSAYKAASNGLLVSNTQHNGNSTFHWKHRYPIDVYLIAIAVTNYDIYKEYYKINAKDSMEVLNYVYPEDKEFIMTQTSQLSKVFDYYSKVYGPYPFLKEKYGHAQFNWSGGMEHQTMTFVGYFTVDILAHELAHQWFGDMVTTNSWHDIWLNEGFATYSTLLYAEKNSNDNNYSWNLGKRNIIQLVTQSPDGSVYVEDTASVDRVFDSRLSYYKACMVIHALRWYVGDTAFFHGITNYLSDIKLKYGNASTNDLKAHFEATSGLNLTEFFDEWYYNQGYPIYNLKVTKNFGNKYVIDLTQTTSHSSVKVFKMPVEIRFKGKNGDTSIVFSNTLNKQSYQAELDFDVDSVFFDPNYWILCKSTTSLVNGIEESELDKDLFIYPNPVQSELTIECNNIKVRKLELFNMIGVNVLENNNISQSSSFHLDLSSLPDEIYVLKVYTDKKVIIRKISKN